MFRSPDWREQWRLSADAMLKMTETMMKTRGYGGINPIARVNMLKD